MINADNKPLLSIITVALDLDAGDFYDTARSLEPLLIHQNLVEWLVVPGGAVSDTARHSCNRAILLAPTEAGIYEAMNAGLDAASGAYVWFLNGGDTLTGASAGNRLLDIIRATPAPDFVYTDSLEHRADGRDWYKPSHHHRLIDRGMFTHHQAMVYRRDTIGPTRFEAQYRIAADYAFTLRHLRTARRVHYQPMALCRFQPGGASTRETQRGQREQREIRRAILGLSRSAELSITARQWFSQQLRRLAPRLWERWRAAE